MTPTAGQWAEICQGGRWLPFLVTAVHDADTVSGVAFSGQPAQVGWHRPSQDFAGVTRGERNREWREVDVVDGGASPVNITEEVKAAVAEFLPTPDQINTMIREAATAAVAEAMATKAPPEPDEGARNGQGAGEEKGIGQPWPRRP